MNSKHPSARLADIIEGDEQGQLVLKIQALAYRINQASVADVFVDQAPTTLRVRVVEYFKNEPTIDDALSLGGPETAGVTNALLMCRLRKMIAELQLILDRGDKRDGAA